MVYTTRCEEEEEDAPKVVETSTAAIAGLSPLKARMSNLKDPVHIFVNPFRPWNLKKGTAKPLRSWH